MNARINKQLDGVPFPLHKSSNNDAGVHWSTIQDIDLALGGSFISDPDLDPKHLPGILEFFASLVTFESKTRTNWVKDPAVYDTMLEYLLLSLRNSVSTAGTVCWVESYNMHLIAAFHIWTSAKLN